MVPVLVKLIALPLVVSVSEPEPPLRFNVAPFTEKAPDWDKVPVPLAVSVTEVAPVKLPPSEMAPLTAGFAIRLNVLPEARLLVVEMSPVLVTEAAEYVVPPERFNDVPLNGALVMVSAPVVLAAMLLVFVLRLIAPEPLVKFADAPVTFSVPTV